MSSAGAQAVAVALPCWVCRPSAWASIGLIWAISSWALRRSWNGSHRIMVVIWSPRLVGRVARRLGEDADRVADQRSLTELNYVHSSLNIVHLSRTAFRMEPGHRAVHYADNAAAPQAAGRPAEGAETWSAPSGQAATDRVPMVVAARTLVGNRL